MRTKTSMRITFILGSALAYTVGFSVNARGQEFVLQNFTGSSGANPQASLITDSAGNLYGTTYSGGFGFGTVFELVNSPSGYTEAVLHRFGSLGPPLNGQPQDGDYPEAGLVMDSAGDLYGTTYSGGANDQGTVFELKASSSPGAYTYQVLYNFQGATDGGNPEGNLVIDAVGDLYGTTYTGGTDGRGSVFELLNTLSGYTEQVLYSFLGQGTTSIDGLPPDGGEPAAGLVMDAAGNLYGTTYTGGNAGQGIVFELKVSTPGSYDYKILYNFQGGAADGSAPEAGLVIDSAGNLYGTTYLGGTDDIGTVFELVNSSSGYIEQVLHNFIVVPGPVTDGANPQGSLVIDSAGNLYGTTSSGGFGGGFIFELKVSSSPGTLPVTHTFQNVYFFRVSALGALGGATPGMIDGANPEAGLLIDAAGNLDGTTYNGGAYNAGTVFRIGQCQTATSLTSSPNPAIAGQSIVLTATVSDCSGTGGTQPSGSVQFFDGSALLGTATLNGDTPPTASITVEDAEVLGIGTSTLTAQYVPGAATFDSSSGTLLQTVSESGVATIAGGNTFVGNQTITGSLITNGNLTASFLFGNGSGITNLNPLNISPGTANISITGNAATASSAVAANSASSALYAASSGSATALTLGASSIPAASFARLDIGNSFTGNQTVSGNQIVSGSLLVGGGTAVSEMVSATFPVTLPAITSGQCAEFSPGTVAGFTPGGSDTIALGIPSSLLSVGGTGVFLMYEAWETNTNLSPPITIQICNPSGSRYKGGASGSIRVDIIKH